MPCCSAFIKRLQTLITTTAESDPTQALLASAKFTANMLDIYRFNTSDFMALNRNL
jgi:hypothetical protein